MTPSLLTVHAVVGETVCVCVCVCVRIVKGYRWDKTEWIDPGHRRILDPINIALFLDFHRRRCRRDNGDIAKTFWAHSCLIGTWRGASDFSRLINVLTYLQIMCLRVISTMSWRSRVYQLVSRCAAVAMTLSQLCQRCCPINCLRTNA